MRKVSISELRRGDMVYDMDGAYKVYSAPKLKGNVWFVETTSTSEHACDFQDGDVLWTHPPEGSPYYGQKSHPQSSPLLDGK